MSVTQSSYRLLSFPLAFAAALGLAVLFFGTAYKMEQYPTQGCAFKVMPAAKLLTEKERPAGRLAAEASSTEQASRSASLAIAANFFAALLRKFSWQHFTAGNVEANRHPRPKRDPARTHFAFRPPPQISIA